VTRGLLLLSIFLIALNTFKELSKLKIKNILNLRSEAKFQFYLTKKRKKGGVPALHPQFKAKLLWKIHINNKIKINSTSLLIKETREKSLT
jgi:hypothetical protein